MRVDKKFAASAWMAVLVTLGTASCRSLTQQSNESEGVRLELADGSLIGNGRGYVGDDLSGGLAMLMWMPVKGCASSPVRMRFTVFRDPVQASIIRATLDSDACGQQAPRELTLSGANPEFEFFEFAGGPSDELWMGVGSFDGALLTNAQLEQSSVPASLPEAWCRGANSLEILVRSSSSESPTSARVSIPGAWIPGETHSRSEVDPFPVDRSAGPIKLTYRAPGFTLEVDGPANPGSLATGRARMLINSVGIEEPVLCHLGAP
jgi:hypothetical protein